MMMQVARSMDELVEILDITSMDCQFSMMDPAVLEARYGSGDNCWELVLKCYELRTRQQKMLIVKDFRPSEHYHP